MDLCSLPSPGHPLATFTAVGPNNRRSGKQLGDPLFPASSTPWCADHRNELEKKFTAPRKTLEFHRDMDVRNIGETLVVETLKSLRFVQVQIAEVCLTNYSPSPIQLLAAGCFLHVDLC